MRKLRLTVSAAVVVAAGAMPAAAQAIDPGTFASAEDGSLLIASSVLVEDTSADMRGFWTDESVTCTASRRLRVTIRVDREVNGDRRSVVRRRKSGLVRNCAEGGPNFGFTVRAANAGVACPDGSWRRGRYDMSTTTRFLDTGFKVTASLFFRIRGSC